MKAILAFTFIFLITVVAVVKDTTQEVKVETVTLKTVLAEEVKQNNEIARLYKFKNSKVKKALAFKTRKNNSKLS